MWWLTLWPSNFLGGTSLLTLMPLMTWNISCSFPRPKSQRCRVLRLLLDSSRSCSGVWQCANITPVTVTANVTTDQNLMSCTISRRNSKHTIEESSCIFRGGSLLHSSRLHHCRKHQTKTLHGGGLWIGYGGNAVEHHIYRPSWIQATNDQFNLTGVSTTRPRSIQCLRSTRAVSLSTWV